MNLSKYKPWPPGFPELSRVPVRRLFTVCACGEKDEMDKHSIVDLVLVVIKIVILTIEITMLAP